MNRDVEERIVAMYFDNKDFEKNAQTTLNTLGQLKNGLNLEESASKGMGVFEKLGKTLNFEKSNRSLQTMKGKLSSMSGALGKIFKIGENPLKEAEGVVNSLRGYVSKVFGFDLASKLVGSIESAFRNLTVAPLSAGWDQYQSKMDSVKTIMSSTGESIEVVERHLQSMTDYANKTIYSLTDMTSNLGKFTNNGIELERATKAMEGIANATADAGQGAQSASMAMYNISQAMGVGKMTTIDWKSLENANIATQRLKNTFLEMAAASGKLKKEIKQVNGESVSQFYLEYDEDGKKLKERIELTAANFREYLSKGWLTKETMLRTFELYSGQGMDEDVLKSWGITDPEVMKNLLEIGEQALNAATQVRTFSKMYDALRESVQSGWAQSFEIIFGNMEEGTQLWTQMNEKIDSILTSATENRNAILKAWSESTEAGSYWTKDKNNNTIRTGIKGGREILIDSVFEMMDILRDFGSMVSETFGSIFGKIDGKKLFDLTLGFRDMVNNIRTWLGSLSSADSRISKIQKALRGVFSVLKAGVTIFRSLINLGVKLVKPIIDPLLNAFSRIGEFFDGFGDLTIGQMLEKIGQGLSSTWDKIKRFFSPKELYDERGIKMNQPGEMPFITWLKKVGDTLRNTIRNWMYENDLGGLYEGLSSIWDTISSAFTRGREIVQEAFESVREWWNTAGIGEFFERIWKTVSGYFNGQMITHDERGIELYEPVMKEAPIVTFFKNLWKEIEGAYKDLKDQWDRSKIRAFFENVWDTVSGIFRPEVITHDEKGFELKNPVVKEAPIVAFFNGIWEGIENAYNALKSKWEESKIKDFFTNIWDIVSGVFRPEVVTHDERGIELYEPIIKSAPIVTFFSNIWEGIENAYNDLKNKWEESRIKEFFTNIWDIISGVFRPEVITHDERGIELYSPLTKDAPIITFFKNIWSGIEDAYNELKNKWEESRIKQFFEDAWNTISGVFRPEVITHDERGIELYSPITREAPIVTFFNNIWTGIQEAYAGIKAWWEDPNNNITSFFSGIWDTVSGWFTEADPYTGKTGFDTFISGIAEGMKEAWRALNEDIPWDKIRNFFSNIWNTVMGWFDGEASAEAGAGAAADRVGREHVQGKMRAAATRATEFANQIISDVGSGAPKSEAVKATDKLSIFQAIFKTLTDFFNTIKEVYEKVSSSSELQRFLSAFASFMEGLMHAITIVMEALGRVMKGQPTSGDILTGVGIGIAAIIDKVFTVLTANNLAKVGGGQNFAQKFIEIAGGLFLLATAVGILTAVDQSKLWSAVGVIVVLGVVISAIAGVFAAIRKDNNDAPVGKGERILTTLINSLSKMGLLFIALKMLPGIIKSFGDLKKELGDVSIGDDMLKSALALSALITTISLVMVITNKAFPKGMDVASTVTSTFSLMAAIAIFITAMEAIVGLIGGTSHLLGGEDNTNETIKILNEGGDILRAVGQAIGGFVFGLLGFETSSDQIDRSLTDLSKIGEAAQAFDIEKISGISRMMALISQLADSTQTFNSDRLVGFGKSMGEIGSGIYSIASYIEEVEGPLMELHNPDSLMFQRLEGFVSFGRQLGTMLSTFGTIHLQTALQHIEDLSSKDNFLPFLENMQTIMAGLGTLNDPNQGIQFDGLSIATKLVLAIQEGMDSTKLPSFDATSIIDDILTALNIGSGAIALAVHEMVQQGLGASGSPEGSTPYTLTPEQSAMVSKLISGESLDSNSDVVNKFKKLLYGEDGTGGILGELSNFESQIPSLASMFENKGWMNFQDENGNEIDLLSEVQSHLTELGKQIDTMDPLKVTITPVFDFENLKPENLSTQVGMQAIPLPIAVDTGKLQVDFSGLGAELGMDGLRTRLDTLANTMSSYGSSTVVAINALGSHMDSVASAVASIRLYLDTGALVGGLTPYIDSAIYQRSWITSRTGTSLTSASVSSKPIATRR